MKERLIIKNFGPIKDVELELGKFNVLIGENATGKSTVAKLLSLCRDFSFIIDDALGNSIFSTLENKSKFLKGLESWGLDEAVKIDSFIYYDCNHYSFRLSHIPEVPYKFSITLRSKSNEFEHLVTELNKLNLNLNNNVSKWNIPTSFLDNDVARVLDKLFFLPTERGLQSIFSLGKTPIISDALFSQLADLYQIAQNFSGDTVIEPLDILYKNEAGVGKIRRDKGEDYFSLHKGASGYQSLIPIVLAMKYYKEKEERKTFIIEEPELNLFPSVQAELMKFFSDQTRFHNSILLTTHSPYILTSLNNLMYAYQIGQEYSKEVEGNVEKKYWVNPDDVSAYRLTKDGTAKNILDAELKQIDAGELDEISRNINDTWDKLSDIKFSAINEH